MSIDSPLLLWWNDQAPRAIVRNWRGSAAGALLVSNGPPNGLSYPSARVRVQFEMDSRMSAPPPNAWLGSLIDEQRDSTGLLYRRNRYYDPATGRFTQEDPIGLAGGMNLYGYAGGDPVNNSDPFGLCPPEDDDPCDMNTGDPLLDNPASRNRMERGYKGMKKDADGYYVEAGESCTASACTSGKNATRDNITLTIVLGRTQYDWHTHGNVGSAKPGGGTYLSGPSEADVQTAGVFRHPSYIVEKDVIHRISRDGDGNLILTAFNRWKAP